MSILKALLSPKKIEIILVFCLFLLSAFFRLWQISDYVVFLGDEGRDMIVMRDIFTKGDLPFLGPTASVGGFYLGPIYYWMAAPFLLMWNFNPIGPSYMVAFFGIATVLLLYKFLKESVGFWPAIIASGLYAVAPLVVRYSRSSWNPNPLPFFSLLMIYTIYKGIKTKRSLFYYSAGACLGIIAQLHYLGLIMAPIGGLIILLNEKLKSLPKIFLLVLLGTLTTFSPFIFFEARHNFPNTKTILEFATRGSTVGVTSHNLPFGILDTGNMFLKFMFSIEGESNITKNIFLLLLLSLIFLIYKFRKIEEKKVITIIAAAWFLGGLIAIRFYMGQIYDYYFGSLFPSLFLVFGVVCMYLWENRLTRIIAVLIAAAIFVIFLKKGFYTNAPNHIIEQTQTVSHFVVEKAQNQPYNFALISDSNSDHAYRYFLENEINKPTKLEDNVTDQLLILCESKKCEPLGHPLWEIAAFGRGDIAGEWDLPKYGFKVFRLTHWPGEPSPAGKPAIKGSK